MGPNLTFPMLNVSWSPPPGGNQGFELNLNSDTQMTFSRTHTFTGLKYNTLYKVMLWTIGCGKKSTVESITCMTGITSKESYYFCILCLYVGAYHIFLVFVFVCVCVFVEPVVPKITAVSISELQYNKFTLNLQSDIFDDSNGPVLFYGVLVYTDTLGMSNKPETFMFSEFIDLFL